jgi:AcrR family transcriptional regulator
LPTNVVTNGNTDGSTVRRMPPRRLTRAERERQLVDTATELFARHGVVETTVEDIARAAGVSKPLLYRHFESREDLLVATAIRHVDALGERVEALGLDDEPPEERVVAVVGAVCDLCADEPAFMDAAILLLRHPFPELEARVNAARLLRLGRSMAAVFGTIAADLAEIDGVPDPAAVSTSLYLQAIGAMYAARHGVGIRRAAPGIPQRFELGHDEVRGHVLAGVRAALRTGAYAEAREVGGPR